MARFERLDLDYRREFAPYGDRFTIGVIGAGFIVREVQLVAYRDAGFRVGAIASRSPERAREVAAAFGIQSCPEDWRDVVRNPEVDILDIAFPAHLQIDVIREAVEHADHIRGILAQKPLAPDLATAAEAVRLCNDAGIALSVNQNMRYDQGIRTLKSYLDRGLLGQPLVAQINMNVRLDWPRYAEGYPRKAMLIMSVHHLDCFRFLFGEPERIFVSTRSDVPPDPQASDQAAVSVLEYAGGLRAVALDNCFAWADKRIEWRVDGTEGMAKGRVGWPDHPWGSPSTIDVVARDDPDRWFRPRWAERWFPDAFAATMGQLLRAVDQGGALDITAADNLRTMALLEAAYQSAAEGRAIKVGDATVRPAPVHPATTP